MQPPSPEELGIWKQGFCKAFKVVTNFTSGEASKQKYYRLMAFQYVHGWAQF